MDCKSIILYTLCFWTHLRILSIHLGRNGQKDLFDDGGQNYSDVTKNILHRAGEREAHYSLQIQTRAGLLLTPLEPRHPAIITSNLHLASVEPPGLLTIY